MNDLSLGPWLIHLVFALSGATALGIVSHAVNTFPVPKNKYGQWLLGVVQYTVGQRLNASKTFAANGGNGGNGGNGVGAAGKVDLSGGGPHGPVGEQKDN